MKWNEETHVQVLVLFVSSTLSSGKSLGLYRSHFFCLFVFFLESEGVKLVQKWKRECMQSLSAVHWAGAKVRWKHESVFKGQVFLPK